MRLTVISTYRKLFRTLMVLFILSCLPGRSSAATKPITGTTTFNSSFPGLTVLINAQPSPQTATNVGTSTPSGWDFTATAPTDNVSISAQAGGFTGVASDLYIRLNRQTPGKTLTSGGIKSNDGSFFGLTSFHLRIGASAAANIIITGYRANLPVTGATTTVALANNVWTLITLSTVLNAGVPAFAAVDEFRITQAGSTTAQIGNFSIDDITIMPAASLPLTLTNFSGHAEGSQVQLQWTTASEQNTSAFEIQRGLIGSDPETIGQVAAAGNSSQPINYQYTDNPPSTSASAWLYRLKMTDLDGRFTYSPVLKIGLQTSASSFSVYPNPFRQQASIVIQSPAVDHVRLTVTDMGGKVILTENIAIQQGTTILSLPSPGRLSKGTYLLTAATSRQKQTVQVVKLE